MINQFDKKDFERENQRNWPREYKIILGNHYAKVFVKGFLATRDFTDKIIV